jgi:hypothetical protein
MWLASEPGADETANVPHDIGVTGYRGPIRQGVETVGVIGGRESFTPRALTPGARSFLVSNRWRAPGHLVHRGNARYS